MVHEFNEPSLWPSHSVLTSPTRLSLSIIPHKLRGIHPVGLASITLVRQRRGARMRAWQARRRESSIIEVKAAVFGWHNGSVFSGPGDVVAPNGLAPYRRVR